MKTIFLGHACLNIQDGTTKILLDPYLKKSSWAGQLYITEVHHEWRQHLESAEYIAFSHAHDDHYNEAFIKSEWDLFKNKIIIVPKFKARFFFDRLRKIGFENIVELEEESTTLFGNLSIEVVINNRDMDSSWFFTSKKGYTMLAQTDNLNLDSLLRYSNSVDILFYMFNQTGIFPNFLNVPFKEKVELLQDKRECWYGRIREFIDAIKPKKAYGYASDLYYGNAIEANLVEVALDYPDDLYKAQPGLEVDLDEFKFVELYVNNSDRLSRIYEAIERDRVDRIFFNSSLLSIDKSFSQKDIQAYADSFIANLSISCAQIIGTIYCHVDITKLSSESIYKKTVSLGRGCGDNLELELKIPLPYIYLLQKRLIEMGAIGLWNGAITFSRKDPRIFSTLERSFWRSFRRMPYYD